MSKQKKKTSNDGTTYTDDKPSWLEWIVPERFNNPELFRIVTFFVFHSPCSDICAMSKSLNEYGWNMPWQKPYYLNRQLKDASSNYKLLFSASTYSGMQDALAKADLLHDFPNQLENERICIYDCKENQFMSVFYHIRNSFAHGRLNMKDIGLPDNDFIFVFEDIARKSKLSARMIIKKSTLLKWIAIIEHKSSEWRKGT